MKNIKNELSKKTETDITETKKMLKAEWYKTNQEKIKLSNKAWNKANPEKMKEYYTKWKNNNLEKIKTYSRTWYKNNLEKRKIYRKLWYKNNLEKVKLSNAIWKRNNPNKRLAHSANRRAIKRNAPGNGITGKQWEELLDKSGGVCYYCGEQKENLTMDHVMPLSKGGAHDIINIVPACLSCNCSKGTQLLNEWPSLKKRKTNEK
jgi:5-methylcytosine-specific restriction endonuclease McrA